MAVMCFGETLWDYVGADRSLGGAPLNVAYHLARLGLDVRLASAVGDDEPGRTALERIHRFGVDIGCVRRHPTWPTGAAGVTLDAGGEPRFSIAEPAAWDEIAEDPTALANAVTRDAVPSAVVFGTLALRRTPNRNALLALLSRCPGALIACDVNLRPPHDIIEPLDALVRRAHLLKVNAAEAARLGSSSSSETRHLAQQIQKRFGAPYVCVTLGQHGAGLLADDRWYQRPSPLVSVVDTIGAGDAFMAALLASALAGQPCDWDAALDRACALGARVARERGAQPEYDPAPFRPPSSPPSAPASIW